MYYLLLLIAIYFLGSMTGMTLWWVHLAAVVFVSFHLHKLAKSYIFWFLLLICLITATEPRFSMEYLLLKLGFASWGFSNWWLGRNETEKFKFFIVVFAVQFLSSQLRLDFSERGSILAWLPIVFSLYYPLKSNLKTVFNYCTTAFALFISNKVSNVVAFISIVFNKIQSIYFKIAIVSIAIFFTFNFETIHHFIEKSLNSRIYIIGSSLKGFMASPIWGHGFGTYAIDVPIFRIISNHFGAHAGQMVSHGHNFFAHYLFELGLIGLALCFTLVYFIYKYARPALIPFLVIASLDTALISFNQFLLASLVLAPYFQKMDCKKFEIPKVFQKYLVILLYIITAIIFIPSLVGHYYYDKKKYQKAIKWDSKHSLYQLMAGTKYLNSNPQKSKKYFEKAISLSPNIGYPYGYLAVTQLATDELDKSMENIDKAMKYSGKNSNWHVIKAIIALKQGDKAEYEKELRLAQKKNPEILFLLKNPSYSPNVAIGSKNSDIRVNSFYRTGEKLHLPLPYIEIRNQGKNTQAL